MWAKFAPRTAPIRSSPRSGRAEASSVRTMGVSRLDHVAVPCTDPTVMVEFYRQLGFRVDDEHAPLLWSVCAGDMKLNLHAPELWQSPRFDLRGPTARPGSADICLVWDSSADELQALLEQAGAAVIEGPVERVGGADHGRTTGVSRYIRDPEDNLVEFIIYPPKAPGEGP